MPSFTLSKEEQEYIEEVNESKIKAIENSEKWTEENKDIMSQYQYYKNSAEYQNSQMKIIQAKLNKYMLDNKYYETAIPLIRKFSKSYDEYYQELLVANDEYIELNK